MRRIAVASLIIAALVGSGLLALRARDQEQVDVLVAEAERLLAPPFAQAPSIEGIEAARARMRLDAAQAFTEDPYVAGLLAYATALDELQKGRLDRAARALPAAEAVLGDEARMAWLQAQLARARGDDEAALRHLDAALARAPSAPRVRRLYAELALARDPAETLTVVASLLEGHPDVGGLYNLRGLAHELLFDADAALRDFGRAIDLDAGGAAACVNRARLLRLSGRHADAEADFARAIQRDASYAEAWLGRGISRIALGDLDGGALDVEKARSLAPGEPDPLVALGDVAARRGRTARAIELYEAAVLADARHSVAWLKLGNAKMRERDAKGAERGYLRATEIAPDLAAAHNGLGAARMTLGNAAGARDALARAAALDPSDPNPLLNLAALHRRAGDEAGASDALSQALARGYVP